MGSERHRPLIRLGQAAGETVGRALPRWRRSPVLARRGATGTLPGRGRLEGRTGADPNEGGVTVRLLAVTDFHGALLSPGERDGRPVGGAAALAAYLPRERAATPGRTLLLHTGDVVGHSPAVSGLLQDEPAVAVLEAVGFDAGVVGNHEFDEGLDELFRLVDGGAHPATLWRSGSFPGCSFPWLAGNVVAEATGHPILPAYRVFDLAGVRVAVIGVVTTETPRRVGGGALGLRFLDEAATVNRYVRELREGPERAAAVVVLAHLGGTTAQPGQPAGALAGPMARFAAALDPGVDAVIGGHLHAHSYVVTAAGTLVVQGPPHGRAYAAVDLRIDPAARRVVDRAAELVSVWADAVAPDPAVETIVARAKAAAAPLAAARIATATVELRRTPADDPAAPGLGGVVARAFAAATGAEVAVVHPGELRANLPAGPLTRGDLYAVLPAGQQLVRLRLTGEQLRRLLEEQWLRERTSRLHLAGLAAETMPEAPRGQRVRRLRLADGSPIERGRAYAVAMSGFLAGGGDGFRVPLLATERTPGPAALDALAAFLHKLPQPITDDHVASEHLTSERRTAGLGGTRSAR